MHAVAGQRGDKRVGGVIDRLELDRLLGPRFVYKGCQPFLK